MTSCGVVPAVAQSVTAVLEYAAGHIGKFEADQFKVTLDQGFYDMDEASHKQMLYIGLMTVSHIWNRMMKSRIDLRPGKALQDHLADFLVLLHTVDPQVKTLGNRVAIRFRKSEDGKEPAPDRTETQCADPADGCKCLWFSVDEVIGNPFGIARDIVRCLAPEEWRTYELLNVARLSMP